MNTASTDLELHLGILRERMQHPTDYEQSVHYFLDEFAGDAAFIQQCTAEDAPHLLAVVSHVITVAIGQPAAADQSRVFHLAGRGFFHGSVLLPGRVALFFYLQELDTGVMAIIPGIRGTMEVARFRLAGGLVNPKNN